MLLLYVYVRKHYVCMYIYVRTYVCMYVLCICMYVLCNHPNQNNVNNANNVRSEATIYFRKKRRNLKAQIYELENTRNSKIKNIRHLKDYQPRTNIVTEEKSDLVTDYHTILAR